MNLLGTKKALEKVNRHSIIKMVYITMNSNKARKIKEIREKL